MKLILLYIVLLVLAVVVSACSSPETDDQPTFEPTEEAAIVAAPSREAVFVYSDKAGLPKTLSLLLGGEPFLLPSGYARLVGVVSGDERVASLQIGGRGLSLKEGEMVDSYQVATVLMDRINLRQKMVSR